VEEDIRGKGVRKGGGWGYPPPLELDILQKL